MRTKTSRSSGPPGWLPTDSFVPRLTRQVSIPHKPDDVFSLVADIKRYPEFIRWIRSMRVTDGGRDGSVHKYRGEADVGFKGFSERFATDVVANAEDRTIKVDLARGPFRHLKNNWTFQIDSEKDLISDPGWWAGLPRYPMWRTWLGSEYTSLFSRMLENCSIAYKMDGGRTLLKSADPPECLGLQAFELMDYPRFPEQYLCPAKSAPPFVKR